MIEVQGNQGITILCLPKCKWQDDAVTDSVGEEIIDYVDKNEPRKVIFDFTRVDVYRDRFIRPLMHTKKVMDNSGGRLILAAMDKNVSDVFKLLNLDRVFCVVDSVETAVKELSG